MFEDINVDRLREIIKQQNDIKLHNESVSEIMFQDNGKKLPEKFKKRGKLKKFEKIIVLVDD